MGIDLPRYVGTNEIQCIIIYNRMDDDSIGYTSRSNGWNIQFLNDTTSIYSKSVSTVNFAYKIKGGSSEGSNLGTEWNQIDATKIISDSVTNQSGKFEAGGYPNSIQIYNDLITYNHNIKYLQSFGYDNSKNGTAITLDSSNIVNLNFKYVDVSENPEISTIVGSDPNTQGELLYRYLLLKNESSIEYKINELQIWHDNSNILINKPIYKFSSTLDSYDVSLGTLTTEYSKVNDNLLDSSSEDMSAINNTILIDLQNNYNIKNTQAIVNNLSDSSYNIFNNIGGFTQNIQMSLHTPENKKILEISHTNLQPRNSQVWQNISSSKAAEIMEQQILEIPNLYGWYKPENLIFNSDNTVNEWRSLTGSNHITTWQDSASKPVVVLSETNSVTGEQMSYVYGRAAGGFDMPHTPNPGSSPRYTLVHVTRKPNAGTDINGRIWSGKITLSVVIIVLVILHCFIMKDFLV